MNKFEKLMEYIINDEDSKARALFHEIVVEKSRDIYESIMDEEQVEETFAAPAVAGNEVEEMVSDVSAEEAVGEDDEEGAELELGADDEEGFADDSAEETPAEEHEEIEDKVMNIDAKLDELLAKFDEIMGDDSAEETPAEEPAFGGEEEVGAEEMPMMEEEDIEEEEEEEEESESKEKTEESKSNRIKSTSELMREYVDTIGNIYGGQGDAAEGDAVGSAGKKTSVNTKDPVGPGNNFGGTAVTSKGGNQDQDGTTPTKASNYGTKGQGEIKSGNQNVPGGKAALAKGPAANRTSEESAVNDKPVQTQNTGKK
jgi:hypothetical protein